MNRQKQKLLLLILLAPIAYMQAQDLKWVNTYTGTVNFEATGMAIDSNQNVITVGTFQQTYDFDPGPGLFNLTSTGGSDCFVQKLDSGGNLIWAKSYSADRVSEIETDPNGNIYLIGNNQSPGADFDPGPGVFVLGNARPYLVKLDSNGLFKWAIGYGAVTALTQAPQLAWDPTGGLFIAGPLEVPTADLDPGPGVHNVNLAGSTPDKDFYVLKLDTLGAFAWAASFGSASFEAVSGLEVDHFGNVHLVGSFQGALDFDPGPGNLTMLPGSNNFPNGFALRLNQSGSLDWAKGFLGTGRCQPQCVQVDNAGNVYIGGEFSELIDFDPGNGQAFMNAVYSTSFVDGFITKLDISGQFVWTKRWTGPIHESIDQLDFGDNGDLIVAGRAYSGADLDPGAGIFLVPGTNLPGMFFSRIDADGDFLWGKMFQANSSWTMFNEIAVGVDTSIYAVGHFGLNIDFEPGAGIYMVAGSTAGYNHFWGRWKTQGCNSLVCAFDSVGAITCAGGTGFVSAHASGGTTPYTYQWTNQVPGPNGYFTPSLPGIYEVIVRDSNLCSQNRQVIVDGPVFPSGYDLRADLFASSFRPGFSNHVWIDAQNQGCTTIGGQLQLIYDSQVLSLQSSNPFPTVVSGDTLIWQLPPLSNDSTHFFPELTFGASNLLSIPSWLCFDLLIVPTIGDLDTSNNHSNRCYPVVNGFDPNFKEVFPRGKCQQRYVEFAETPLSYTIHFQNTGNADAINILVLDTIDTELDLETVRILGSSHPMIAEVLPGGVLQFRFDNIHLPDSNANEPLSHGFIMFEIKPDSGMAPSTIVRNGSAIYFDFNAPVITNLVSNTMVDSIPSQPSLLASAIVCPGDSFVFPDGDVAYNIQNSISHLSYFLSAEGCDSTWITTILLGNSTSQFTTDACESYTSPSGAFTWSTSGFYTDTLQNALGCDSVISIALTVHHPDTGVIDFGDSLFALASGGQLQWLNCDSAFQSIPGANSQSFTPSQSGNFALAVTENGCVDTSSCYSVVIVGLQPIHLSGTKVVPNPNHGQFIVEFASMIPQCTIELFDVQGSMKEHLEIRDNHQITFSEPLQSGIYFLKVLDSNGQFSVEKVVVR